MTQWSRTVLVSGCRSTTSNKSSYVAFCDSSVGTLLVFEGDVLVKGVVEFTFTMETQSMLNFLDSLDPAREIETTVLSDFETCLGSLRLYVCVTA